MRILTATIQVFTVTRNSATWACYEVRMDYRIIMNRHSLHCVKYLLHNCKQKENKVFL